jgi:hypothetical protein
MESESRQAQMELRDVGAPQKWVWLVDPEGYPKRVPTAKNINNGYTFVDDSGHTRLLGVHEENGWRLMARVISAPEMRTWLDYHRQSDAKRGRMKPLPDELWPAGIKRRRERNAKDTKADYEPNAEIAPPRGVSEGAPADPGATTRASRNRG